LWLYLNQVGRTYRTKAERNNNKNYIYDEIMDITISKCTQPFNLHAFIGNTLYKAVFHIA